MEYLTCGPACPEICGDDGDQECQQDCIEGCQCVEGFVLDNDGCIPLEDCGCIDNGQYYQVRSETIVIYLILFYMFHQTALFSASIFSIKIY